MPGENPKRAGDGGSLARVAWIRISLRSFRLKTVGQDVFSALRESICQYAVMGGAAKIEFNLRPDYRMGVFLIRRNGGRKRCIRKSLET